MNECAQQSFYRSKALSFVADHPGEKAKLAGQAVRMLWDPRVQKTEGRPGAGGFIDRVRTWVQPVYEIPLYLLAIGGLVLMPRRIAVLIVLLLGYQTVVAIGFAGDTRYRVPWDFTLALAAGVAVVHLCVVAHRPAHGAPDRPVKVVHVHRIRGIGGSERHLLTLLPALAERGVDVSFVGLDDPAGALDPFYRELTVGRSSGSCAPRDLDPALAFRLARTLRSSRPDLVHTHLVHADVYGALAPGMRVVSTKHNPDPFRAGAFRFAERALTRRAARVIAISEAVRRFCIDRVGLPAGKVEVVHYGLDSLPRPWAENPPLELGERRSCSPSAASRRRRGWTRAVRALPELPDATLLVLGEGPDRAALESLASSLGVRDRVLLPGRVGDVASLYGAPTSSSTPRAGRASAWRCSRRCSRPSPSSPRERARRPSSSTTAVTGPARARGRLGRAPGAVSSLLADPGSSRGHGRAPASSARDTEFSVARMAERTLALLRVARVTIRAWDQSLDSIKRFFGPKDGAARDERGADTAETNEPHGETSTDVTGKAVDTVTARYVGESEPATPTRLSDLGRPLEPAVRAQRALVERLRALDAARLEELRQRSLAAEAAHLGARGRGRPPARRSRARSGSATPGLDEQPGLAVADELAEPADRGGDHRPRALHRLERDHPEALAHRRHDDDRRLLDRALDRRDVAEEAHRVGDAELARERPQRRLERPAAGDVEPRGRAPRLRASANARSSTM